MFLALIIAAKKKCILSFTVFPCTLNFPNSYSTRVGSNITD